MWGAAIWVWLTHLCTPGRAFPSRPWGCSLVDILLVDRIFSPDPSLSSRSLHLSSSSDASNILIPVLDFWIPAGLSPAFPLLKLKTWDRGRWRVMGGLNFLFNFPLLFFLYTAFRDLKKKKKSDLIPWELIFWMDLLRVLSSDSLDLGQYVPKKEKKKVSFVVCCPWSNLFLFTFFLEVIPTCFFLVSVTFLVVFGKRTWSHEVMVVDIIYARFCQRGVWTCLGLSVELVGQGCQMAVCIRVKDSWGKDFCRKKGGVRPTKPGPITNLRFQFTREWWWVMSLIKCFFSDHPVVDWKIMHNMRGVS